MSKASPPAAIVVASRAALRTLTLPHTFRKLVTREDVRAETYTRVAYRIERRRVELRHAPARGVRRTDLRQPPAPGSVDPWAIDPVTLPAYSRTPCPCPACAGERKLICGTCRGSARVGCGACHATGRVAGQRGPKNCPTCRGQSTVTCPSCTRGRVDCFTCDAGGAVFAWLEVTSEQQVHVHVHPRDGIASLHADVMSLPDMDLSPASFRNRLTKDSGWQPPAGISERELRPVIDAVGDRVLAQRVQRFESAVHEFSYATAIGSGVVRVAGNPLGVLPNSGWGPLFRRTAVAGGLGIFAALAAMLVRGKYVGQAPWFTHNGNGPQIVVLGLVAAPLLAAAIAGWLLPRRLRGVARTWLPSSLVLAAWAAIAVLWSSGGPTVSAAVGAMDGADLEAAREELAAVAAVGGDRDGFDAASERLVAMDADALRLEHEREDDEHLEQVRRAESLWTAVNLVGKPWHTDQHLDEAHAAVHGLAAQVLAEGLAAHDEAALLDAVKALAGYDRHSAMRGRTYARIARARTCTAAKEFACAVEALADLQANEADQQGSRALADARSELAAGLRDAVAAAPIDAEDAHARKAAIETAIVEAKAYEALAGEPPPRSIAALESDLRSTERSLEAARKKEAAAEAKRVAAELRASRAAERAAAKAERRSQARASSSSWSGSSHLMCCDGTRSPSCTVGRGSYRGCCSHHGGVCD